jgi:hypothetical protein
MLHISLPQQYKALPETQRSVEHQVYINRRDQQSCPNVTQFYLHLHILYCCMLKFYVVDARDTTHSPAQT